MNGWYPRYRPFGLYNRVKYSEMYPLRNVGHHDLTCLKTSDSKGLSTDLIVTLPHV